MNLTASEAQSLASEVVNMYKDEYQGDAEVIFGVPYPYLPLVHHITKDHPNVHLAAQNLHKEEKGAYTGGVSASMLTSVGVSHVLVGHSERREYQGENNDLLADKIDKALAHELVPIYCFGEKLSEREGGNTLPVIEEQVSEGCFHLSGEDFSKLILAYEPVWAIGTGKTASPEQAQEVHAFVRSLLAKKYGNEIAEGTTILYGGSVKPANAKDLFSQTDIDGGLVGGASLKSRDFTDIIKSFS